MEIHQGDSNCRGVRIRDGRVIFDKKIVMGAATPALPGCSNTVNGPPAGSRARLISDPGITAALVKSASGKDAVGRVKSGRFVAAAFTPHRLTFFVEGEPKVNPRGDCTIMVEHHARNRRVLSGLGYPELVVVIRRGAGHSRPDALCDVSRGKWLARRETGQCHLFVVIVFGVRSWSGGPGPQPVLATIHRFGRRCAPWSSSAWTSDVSSCESVPRVRASSTLPRSRARLTRPPRRKGSSVQSP